ncbi:MAG: alpha/beta fold hydrolase [Acidobacteriota bacterium]|nr:alpha/beta fold hydrolase [Acidobacteriota bacterium]
MSFTGHFYTLRGRLRRWPEPAGTVPWETVVEDPDLGPVRLSGRLNPEGEDLVLLVHGLGGSAESRYMCYLAERATARGLACLRLNLRGSDRQGEDFYHAGQSSDLDAVLASEELASYRRIYLLGCSLGGHLALLWAARSAGSGSADPRVQSVASLCSPVDLEASSGALLKPFLWPYRRYLMNSLMQIYRAVAERRPVPLPVAQAAGINNLVDWDDHIVAPRYGFDGAADYYRQSTVAPILGDATVPILYVGAEDDPMVPANTVQPALQRVGPTVESRWLPRGGHLGFDPHQDLALSASRGWADQVLDWLQGR